MSNVVVEGPNYQLCLLVCPSGLSWALLNPLSPSPRFPGILRAPWELRPASWRWQWIRATILCGISPRRAAAFGKRRTEAIPGFLRLIRLLLCKSVLWRSTRVFRMCSISERETTEVRAPHSAWLARPMVDEPGPSRRALRISRCVRLRWIPRIPGEFSRVRQRDCFFLRTREGVGTRFSPLRSHRLRLTAWAASTLVCSAQMPRARVKT